MSELPIRKCPECGAPCNECIWANLEPGYRYIGDDKVRGLSAARGGENYTALREAAIYANRQIDGIRLRVLEKYPSGRVDLCPLESRCYEVRLLMSAVIRATEDLRRETGMYDGCPNIMPPPADTEGVGTARGGAPAPKSSSELDAEAREIYLVEKARELERQGCAYVTTNHGVLMTYAEHGRLVAGGAPAVPSEAAIQRTALLALGWDLEKSPNASIRHKAQEIAAAVLDAQRNGWGSLAPAPSGPWRVYQPYPTTWCLQGPRAETMYFATEAEANAYRDALNNVVARLAVPGEGTKT